LHFLQQAFNWLQRKKQGLKKQRKWLHKRNGGFEKMGEKSKNGLSVSFRIDSGIVEHNNRHFIAKKR
jgi:hypothetical protein